MLHISHLVAIVSILYIICPSEGATQTASLKTAHKGSVNPGFSSGDCPTSTDGYLYGWHFILPGTTTSFLSINCTFQKAGTVTKMIQQPTDKHAYVFTPTSDTLVDAKAIVSGSETEFVLSHVCNPATTTQATTVPTRTTSTTTASTATTQTTTVPTRTTSTTAASTTTTTVPTRTTLTTTAPTTTTQTTTVSTRTTSTTTPTTTTTQTTNPTTTTTETTTTPTTTTTETTTNPTTTTTETTTTPTTTTTETTTTPTTTTTETTTTPTTTTTETIAAPTTTPETIAAPVTTPETTAAPITTPETIAAPATTPETTAAPITTPETIAAPATTPETTDASTTTPETTAAPVATIETITVPQETATTTTKKIKTKTAASTRKPTTKKSTTAKTTRTKTSSTNANVKIVKTSSSSNEDDSLSSSTIIKKNKSKNKDVTSNKKNQAIKIKVNNQAESSTEEQDQAESSTEEQDQAESFTEEQDQAESSTEEQDQAEENSKETIINDVTYLHDKKQRPVSVTNSNSNYIRDITIDRSPYQYKNIDIDTRQFTGLLAYLLKTRFNQRSSSLSSSKVFQYGNGCVPNDIVINYIYEHDIHNQVFNSSFQDSDSSFVQRLQQDIADWTHEQVYRRNLQSYVTNEVRIVRIVDVSKQYNGQATIRFYVSIVIRKTQIPVMRRILAVVFDKLQEQYFHTSNEISNWSNIVLIPIEK